MLTGNTNLFCAVKNIRTLFDSVNIELQKLSQGFISNKLYLTVTKTKCSIFKTPSKNNNIPLVLQKLTIWKDEIKRFQSIELLTAFVDENLPWKDDIKYTENKKAEKIGLLFRSKPYVTKTFLLSLYYIFIYTYIFYVKTAWGSNYISNLKKTTAKTCNKSYIQ